MVTVDAGSMKMDRVEGVTRVLAAAIVPFLVVAFAILYFRPDDTGRLFAWPIAPHMSAYLLGAAYIGGAYFFVRVVFEKRWHRVSVGFLPVTAFATLMMLATLLHWDRFNQGSIAFTAWVALYATTPFLVAGVWMRNRHTDPRTPEADDVEIPAAVRLFVGTCGALVLGTGIFLVTAPTVLIRVWPWPLTELTARVIGACFALVGVFGVTIVRDTRWSAARIALQSQAIGIGVILVGALRSRDEFDAGSASTFIFVTGMGAILGAIVGLYGVLEWRRARGHGGRLAAP